MKTIMHSNKRSSTVIVDETIGGYTDQKQMS